MHTHLDHFFTERIQDFSLMKEDTIVAIKEINDHFANSKSLKKHDEMKDPGITFLD